MNQESSPGRYGDPIAASGRQHILFSRKDAENAKKTELWRFSLCDLGVLARDTAFGEPTRNAAHARSGRAGGVHRSCHCEPSAAIFPCGLQHGTPNDRSEAEKAGAELSMVSRNPQQNPTILTRMAVLHVKIGLGPRKYVVVGIDAHL